MVIYLEMFETWGGGGAWLIALENAKWRNRGLVANAGYLKKSLATFNQQPKS
jgi:hypothetical protein